MYAPKQSPRARQHLTPPLCCLFNFSLHSICNRCIPAKRHSDVPGVDVWKSSGENNSTHYFTVRTVPCSFVPRAQPPRSPRHTSTHCTGVAGDSVAASKISSTVLLIHPVCPGLAAAMQKTVKQFSALNPFPNKNHVHTHTRLCTYVMSCNVAAPKIICRAGTLFLLADRSQKI